MKFLTPFLVLLSMCIVNTAQADTSSLLSDFMYNGKPIDPLCFNQLEADKSTINLKDCGSAKDGFEKSSENADLLKKGYYGFNWKEKDSTSDIEGSSYYKVFDAGNNQYWVYSINNGGGSGTFTYIQLVKRENNDTMSYKAITGGDRCNGGVQDVSTQDYQLVYSQNITAFDLIDFGNNNQTKLKAYDDLAACAACCVGAAFFKVDEQAKPEFMYIKLEKIKNKDELSEQGAYHDCFNKLYYSYVSKGRTRLDEDKLAAFVKKFNDTCVNKQG